MLHFLHVNIVNVDICCCEYAEPVDRKSAPSLCIRVLRNRFAMRSHQRNQYETGRQNSHFIAIIQHSGRFVSILAFYAMFKHLKITMRSFIRRSRKHFFDYSLLCAFFFFQNPTSLRLYFKRVSFTHFSLNIF